MNLENLTSIFDLIPMNQRRSLVASMSNRQLRAQILQMDLQAFGIAGGARVALLVNNGPHAASLLLAIMNFYCAIPLSSTETIEELTLKIVRGKANCLVCFGGGDLVELGGKLAAASEVTMIPLQELHDGLLTPTFQSSVSLAPSHTRFRTVKDDVLILHTSGTTGFPKKVAFTLGRLVSSGVALAKSLELCSSDFGVNMMPLHHIGGIACNVLAPLVAECSMLFLPRFEPTVWCRTLEVETATWCYAVPTMWHVAVHHCVDTGYVFPAAIRVFRSGAAVMPHQLSITLHSLIPESACFLPTYSMTECMPITSPPLGYSLLKPGSVGLSIGVSLRIVADDGQQLPPGEVGDVALVRGQSNWDQLFRGYENDDSTYVSSPSAEVFETGDIGYVDADGWLFLTSRKKECINRAGELLSPLVIEAVFLECGVIEEVMAFAAMHEEFGEVVAIACTGHDTAQVKELRNWARHRLSSAQLPQVLVWTTQLPRTVGTEKLKRVNFAKEMQLPILTGSAGRTFRFHPERAVTEELYSPKISQHAAQTSDLDPSRNLLIADKNKELSSLLQKFTRDIEAHMYRRMIVCQKSNRDGQRIHRSASGTAKLTMHMRYLANELRFGPDNMAQHFLPLFWASEWPREWEEVYTSSIKLQFQTTQRILSETASVWSTIFDDRISRGVQNGSFGIGYMHCRTRFFDEIVSARSSMPQLVILGAGFDTRCYRLKVPRRCFELDAEETQKEKKDALASAGVDVRHVDFVSVDLASEDWMNQLCQAGFDPELPSLFLWEGVTYYLTDEIIDSVLSRIAKCHNAQVAFDVYYSWYSLHEATITLMRQSYGETFASGVLPGKEGDMAARAGMHSVQVMDSQQANSLYVPHDDHGELVCPAFGAFAFVLAVGRGAPATAARSPVCCHDPTECTKPEIASVISFLGSTTGIIFEADASLLRSGVDSITAVEIQRSFATHYSSTLPSSMVLEATPRSIAAMLTKNDAHDDKKLPPTASHLADRMLGLVAAELGCDVCADDNLVNLGLDSISAIKLQKSLAGILSDNTIPTTLMFDQPTARQLAERLLIISIKTTPPLPSLHAGSAPVPEVCSSQPLRIGPTLTRMQASAEAQSMLFAVPGFNGTFIPDNCLFRLANFTTYVVNHPYRSSVSDTDLQVDTLPALIEMYTHVICDQLNGKEDKYCLIGSCVGAMLASLIASASRSFDRQVHMLVLLDPPPSPECPRKQMVGVPKGIPVDLKSCAGFVACTMASGVMGQSQESMDSHLRSNGFFEGLRQQPDSMVSTFVANYIQSLSSLPLDMDAIRRCEVNIKCCWHTLCLLDTFDHSQWLPLTDCREDHIPTSMVVWASHGRHFFSHFFGVSLAEASLRDDRLFGNILVHHQIEGDHMSALLRCHNGRDQAFVGALTNFLCGSSN